MGNTDHVSQLQMQKGPFDFRFTRTTNANARYGFLTTPHGTIETPAFIFCGTKAAIKSVPISDMKELNTQIILANTYHLMMRPGPDHVEKMGGLHKFMNWDGPMLTDSGGFQVFSLGIGEDIDGLKSRYVTRNKKHKSASVSYISATGVTCKSYYDGTVYLLTPERSIQIQCKLGADLIVVFDECTPFSSDKLFTRDSMEISHEWALRSLEEFNKLDNGTQALYGIIHGGTFKDLRKISAEFNNAQPFFGQAIGGSLGQNSEEMEDVVTHAMANMHPDRPTHLLGIGRIKDVFMGVKNGIDTFDCVHPTRIARHGGALIKPADFPELNREHMNLKNARFKYDEMPIDVHCTCKTCKNHSRAYLHYLLSVNEPVVYTLLTYHNIHFMNLLFQRIRDVLKSDTRLDDLEKEYLG